MPEIIVIIWTEGILKPLLNVLVLLYALLFNNFGLSILVFTIIIRLITMPLTTRQMKATKAMSSLQPKLQEIQKRYAGDKQRASQETMKLYKDAGVSPLGCLGPFVIQLPIWIGLYQAIIKAIPLNPEALVDLSQKLYSWPSVLHQVVPLNSSFLWLDLASPDRTPILPMMVGASTWAMQKLSTPTTTTPQQSSTQSTMLWLMPIMLMMFSFQFPSGLALYWVVSNLVGMGIQYFITGWGDTFNFIRRGPQPSTTGTTNHPNRETVPNEQHKEPGDEREINRGSYRAGAKAARRRPRRGGSRHTQ